MNTFEEILSERISEQHNVSRFIHATIAQELAALSFTLSRLDSLPGSIAVRGDIAAAVRLIELCCSRVRLVEAILAPPVFDDGALEDIIRQLAGAVRAETGTPITLDLDPTPFLSENAQNLLLTMVRSLLTLPALRRVKPAILIRLRNSPNTVLLELEMSPSPAGDRDGWTLLKQCALALGGEFALEDSSGRLIASLSLPEHGGK